jgi:Mitochondrial ribosome subunit S24
VSLTHNPGEKRVIFCLIFGHFKPTISVQILTIDYNPKILFGLAFLKDIFAQKMIHTSAADCRKSAGRYRPTIRQDKPLTYEMANPPHQIAHRKGWNTWNTGRDAELVT